MVIIKSTLKKAAIVLPMALIVACGGNNQGEKQTMSEQDSTNMEDLKEDVKSFNYILPSPLQIASMFHKAKLKFNQSIINSPDNASKYNTETKRLLNIGVYGADLAYCLLNNQNQQSLNYLKVEKELSDKIGMGSIYESENMMVRFKNNLNNIDSLNDIISTIQTDSEAYFEENNKRFSALTVFAGAWVESMYISSQSLAANYNEKLALEIAEQHVSLTNLIKLLSEHEESNNEEFKPIMEGLKKIEVAFSTTADYKVQMQKIVADSTGEEMPFDFKLSQDEMKELAKISAEIRTNIVNI